MNLIKEKYVAGVQWLGDWLERHGGRKSFTWAIYAVVAVGLVNVVVGVVRQIQAAGPSVLLLGLAITAGFGLTVWRKHVNKK